jgi:DNA-binding response OmpR family regulator
MKPKPHILIGDRNKNIREFLKREFSADGYEVALAKDGSEIISMVATESPDLLIMDLFVQVVDGLIVLEQLQRLEPKPPIIIYSSLVELKHDPLIQNVAAFVEKEDQIDSLKSAVARILHA